MFEDWYLTELITQKIKDTWKLTDFFLLKILYDIIEKDGIHDFLKNEITIDEIMLKKSYSTNSFRSLKWILDRLALDGYISINGDKYKLTDKKMTLDLEDIKKAAKEKAPEGMKAYEMLEIMADSYPHFLKGEKSGVEIIFSPENIDITDDYYRYDLYYNVHNICGSKILDYDLETRKQPNILEIGGGLGGGTIQFLKRRIGNNSTVNFKYCFTDIANKMLRSTKKELLKISNNLDAFEFKKLDFNTDLQSQGYEQNSFDVIWGVNAVHVTRDLEFSLKEFLKILKPGGSLIISETVRPEGNKMIQQEFILNTLLDYWNVKLDENYRKSSGFLSWREWKNAFQSAGFKNVETIPDMSILEKKYDNCYVSVISGRK
jgi:SAM-dependent methyltransferase